jgi:hypothetical protein
MVDLTYSDLRNFNMYKGRILEHRKYGSPMNSSAKNCHLGNFTPLFWHLLFCSSQKTFKVNSQTTVEEVWAERSNANRIFLSLPSCGFLLAYHPIRNLKIYSTWGGLHKNSAPRILVRTLRSAVYCRMLKCFVQSHILACRQPEKPSVNNAHGSRFCENYSFRAPSGSNDNHTKSLSFHVFNTLKYNKVGRAEKRTRYSN